jgi:hypothetical protein
MRAIIVWALSLSLVGCTSLHAIQVPPAELQREILAGALLKSGDQVVVGTADGRSIEFRVSAIRGGELVGKDQSVPIDQIVSLRKREPSVAKTAGLVAVIAVGVLAVAGTAYMSRPHNCAPTTWFCM